MDLSLVDLESGKILSSPSIENKLKYFNLNLRLTL